MKLHRRRERITRRSRTDTAERKNHRQYILATVAGRAVDPREEGESGELSRQEFNEIIF